MLEGLRLLSHPPVVVEYVHRPKDGPVSRRCPDLGQPAIKLRLVHITKIFLAENAADPMQLLRYRRIGPGKVGVIRAAVHYAQGIAAAAEIVLYALDDRLLSVFKVDIHHAAHAGGGLIHKAAGLAEVYIFRVLAYLGYLNGGELILKIKPVYYAPHQHLKGGGAGKAGAGQHG